MTAFIILAVCALAASFGSLAAEFTRTHVYCSYWPTAARHTCARFGLLNCALGLMGLALLALGRPWFAGSLLLLMDLALLGSSFAPGVDIVADRERVVARLPVSFWMTFLHLGLVVFGLGLTGGEG
ncbi:MAG: hypothetical protein K0V04_17585 [Deltaproteobacteria bacterium]|nr:hypothetical protein [Deltaproteobacteria bacterium]